MNLILVLLTLGVLGIYLWDFLNYPESIFRRLLQEVLSLVVAGGIVLFPLMHSSDCSWQFLVVFVAGSMVLAREFVLTLLSRYVPFGKTLLILLATSLLMLACWGIDKPNEFFLQAYTLMNGLVAVVFAIVCLIRRIQRRARGDEDYEF